jgi:hypothetical protein
LAFILTTYIAISQTTTNPHFEGNVVSKAADATIVSYNWSQVSGPNTATIATPNAATTTVSGLVAGVYVFRFTIKDNFGFIGTSDKKVTVNRYGQLPVADAGGDIIIQLGKP